MYEYKYMHNRSRGESILFLNTNSCTIDRDELILCLDTNTCTIVIEVS